MTLSGHLRLQFSTSHHFSFSSSSILPHLCTFFHPSSSPPSFISECQITINRNIIEITNTLPWFTTVYRHIISLSLTATNRRQQFYRFKAICNQSKCRKYNCRENPTQRAFCCRWTDCFADIFAIIENLSNKFPCEYQILDSSRCFWGSWVFWYNHHI